MADLSLSGKILCGLINGYTRLKLDIRVSLSWLCCCLVAHPSPVPQERLAEYTLRRAFCLLILRCHGYSEAIWITSLSLAKGALGNIRDVKYASRLKRTIRNLESTNSH
jgi:hypothetical protein